MKWNEKQILLLRENYDSMRMTDLVDIIGKSPSAIKTKATYLKLSKTKMMYKNDNIKKLLNGSLESLYWIGFCLADGHFENNRRIEFCLSVLDKDHLVKFCNYVDSKLPLRTTTKTTQFADSATMVRFSITHKEYVSELCNLFDIKSNKTKNPPNISEYKLTDEQFIALFIGYIDGDGSIGYTNQKRNRYSINVRVHHSWESNLLFLRQMVYSYFRNHNNYDKVISTLFRDKNGHVILCIGKNQTVKDLKHFAIHNNLPIMVRKWNKVLL